MLRTFVLTGALSLAALPAIGEEKFDVEAAFATFEKRFGVTEGKRRNHTKGFCVEGALLPVDPDIKAYSVSPLFEGPSTVIARLSHKGGAANPADDKFGQLGLSMEITAADGDVHVIGMNTEHFFPVADAQTFITLLQAQIAGSDAVKAFAAQSPALQHFAAYHGALDKTLRPYEGATYNSINAFHLVNAEGTETPIRFAFRPSGEQGIVVETHPDFFMENIQANIARGGVSWDMVVTLANDDDPISDPSQQWTGEHTEIVAARFVAKEAMSEADGRCDEINFDPLVLSAGFAPSADPMLEVRSLIYALGAGARLFEKGTQ